MDIQPSSAAGKILKTSGSISSRGTGGIGGTGRATGVMATHEVAKTIVGNRWLVDAWVYEQDAENFFVLGVVLRVDGHPGGTNRMVEHRRTLEKAKKTAQDWFDRTSQGVEKSIGS